MAQAQTRSKRKVSGGRYHSSRGKKLHELAGFPTQTRLSEQNKIKSKRTTGGNLKFSLLTAKFVNVANKSGKSLKTEIENVIENPANPNLVRRNVITRGSVVLTKLGKVRVTSRPGQEGTINGVLKE